MDLFLYPVYYIVEIAWVLNTLLNPKDYTALYYCLTLVALCLTILAVVLARMDMRKKGTSIRVQFCLPLIYLAILGIISSPIELFWHHMIEGRLVATYDYFVGFHPLLPPYFTNFVLVGDQWVNGSLVKQAKAHAMNISYPLVLAIWAVLSVVANVCTVQAVKCLVALKTSPPASPTPQ